MTPFPVAGCLLDELENAAAKLMALHRNAEIPVILTLWKAYIGLPQVTLARFLAQMREAAGRIAKPRDCSAMGDRVNDQSDRSEDALDARSRRIDLAHHGDFALGAVQVQPSLRLIKGPLGEAMLEPKVMQVLIALSHPAGTILSRDDLIERCWDGRIVGDTSINRVISLVRSGLKEVAGVNQPGSATVETVPKVGYRIILSGAPVAQGEGAHEVGEIAAETAGRAPAHQPGMGRYAVVGAGAALMLVIVAAFFLWPTSSHGPVERERIAMLPIEASEGVDPLYTTGLEAELRAQIARIGALDVTTSESARLLIEQGLDPVEIGKRLNVDYVWNGSFVSESERVILSARLIDVADGSSAWTETLSSAPGSAQFIPLRAARSIAANLGQPVSDRMPETPVSASGYSLYLTATGLIKTRGVEERIAARRILEEVTSENPQFADGWAGFAKALYLFPTPSREEVEEYRAQAFTTANFALTLDEDAVDALKVAGMLHEDAERGLAMLERAVALDPGDSEAWFWLGIKSREFLLLGMDPVPSAVRMVAIDPLWPATWRASDLAAEFGQVDLAQRIEEDILSAAVTPSQRYLAEARAARLNGDLSTFLALSAEAAKTQTVAERRYGSGLQSRMVRLLLGLPFEPGDVVAREASEALVAQVLNGDLPAISEFEAEGAAGRAFFASPTLAMPALPLFLNTGREGELLGFYDDAFAGHEGFLEFAEATGDAAYVVPDVAPYLALAMQRQGRGPEADLMLSAMARYLEQWEASGTSWIKPVLWRLQLASITGDDETASAAIRLQPNYGWPYTMGHVENNTIALLFDDPTYAAARELPAAREVLEPVRERLAREREEVLSPAE